MAPLAAAGAAGVDSRPMPAASPAYLDAAPPPPGLLTGHALVDDEHSRLMGLIDTLHTICADFAGKTSCAGCVGERIADCDARFEACVAELLSYMCEHFRAEEQLMRDSGFHASHRDEFLAHVEDHAAISDRALALLRDPDPDLTAPRVAELSDLLRGWLERHIDTHDRLNFR